MDISKYFASESEELKRSQIHFAEYNPRVIDEDERATLKRGIKRFGIVGGIVVNKRTAYTIVGGHQKISIADELMHYNAETGENDYLLRANVVDIDLESEKTLNILLNNPNAMGRFDNEKLKAIVPDINYKDAGLKDYDLSMIGCDYLLKTEEENRIASELDGLAKPIEEERKASREQRKAEKEPSGEKGGDKTMEERTEHMKEVKQQVHDKAVTDADNMQAYVMLSFSTSKAMNEFLEKFGYQPDSKYIKGEDFETKCEPVIE